MKKQNHETNSKFKKVSGRKCLLVNFIFNETKSRNQLKTQEGKWP